MPGDAGRVAGLGLIHTVHNARITLLATALNNIALAFLVAGLIAPAVTGQLQGRTRLLAVLAWAGTGLVIQLTAQFALGMLRQ